MDMLSPNKYRTTTLQLTIKLSLINRRFKKIINIIRIFWSRFNCSGLILCLVYSDFWWNFVFQDISLDFGTQKICLVLLNSRWDLANLTVWMCTCLGWSMGGYLLCGTFYNIIVLLFALQSDVHGDMDEWRSPSMMIWYWDEWDERDVMIYEMA